MMATAGPTGGSGFLPLLESLEDTSAEQSEQTDAYLTIANRLSGEEGRQFLPAVEKHFSRLGKATLTHINSTNTELSQAALQALGFCLYHSHVVSGVPETFASEILSTLCSLVMKSTDKNTCTRALWVISKQSFPPDVVGKKVPSILGTLEGMWTREDMQSVVMEHEALNVIIRLVEQVPTQMADGVVRWAKLVVPLVVHSASKVRLRAAAAMEMGMPLLLEKQTEVAAVIEPMMSSKLIPELQKLFMSKNETNVLKLWPLFVKLLGKLLHRGGPFINSLLHLEELGFRSSSPTIKKIAFIAWKSLIDNFALNPDILCSTKRMKLLMQPLASIHVRTEPLLLTKVEVWWYLVVQLGPNLSPNFDQVSVPLLQCTIGSDSSSVSSTPSRAVNQNGSAPSTPKTPSSSRLTLNSSVTAPSTFPSIQLLGVEMLLHYFLGPEVVNAAAKNKLVLNLEPLNHPLLSAASSFTKHAAVLVSNVRDGFINIGKDAPDSLLSVIWTSLVRFVNLTIESGSKKDRQGCEVLTLMLQALQSLVSSEALPANKVLILFEATVTGIPQRVLGSASYQVGKMDVLNGTPALFLILLLYNSSVLAAYIEDERFFQCLQTLVGCGLSGHTSPLAFSEAVLGAIGRSAGSVQNKEQLWRMWSLMVGPLTDTITQSNEVNQGDALEHNFSAMHSALLFPATHLLRGSPLQPASQKSMLSSWSKLYKVFARCSALVVTAEENICCEELCAKMAAAVDRDALKVPSTLSAVSSLLQVMVECVDFSPYTPQFQQKLKSPHTPVNWMKKRNKVLGNLSTFQSLLVQCLDVYLDDSEDSMSESTGSSLVSILSTLFSNFALSNTVEEALSSLTRPLTLFYAQAGEETPRFTAQLLGKLEKLLGDVLGCLQTRSSLAFNDELLSRLSPLLCVLFPHKNKQLRTAVAHFWNATFANSVSLTYPEEIRPVLSQVKQKTPIILPGFEVVGVSDELSGHYSSESSQMETKLSGMPVSSVGKRDSMLGKTPEPKDKSITKTPKPVSTKLDFGSPKPPRRGVLEEEASIDFVFIPPETKERVLTEHQKEVKRTKRVDIPAMYNNLDASLDTTVFTQYTQSQEDSLDKPPTEPAVEEEEEEEEEAATQEPPGKAPQEDVKMDEDPEVLTKETQDFASPKAGEDATENPEQVEVEEEEEEMIPQSTDVSMEDVSNSLPENNDTQPKEDASPNMSGSSDLVSGTPQKSNSRRQSFITLEKYAEGKSASPSSASKFAGTLVKTPGSQERSKTKTSSSRASRSSTATNSQESQSSGNGNSQSPESPQRPKDSMKCEPVRLTDRLPSDTTEDEDVIPDTQTEVQDKDGTKPASTSEEIQPSSQDEESEATLDDSQISTTSSGESRRSGRHRVRPLMPGEDPSEREEKNNQYKRRRSVEEPKTETPKSNTRLSTRSKTAEEEDSKLRTRAQRDKGKSGQTKSPGRPSKKAKVSSTLDEFLDKRESRRRSTREQESSQSNSQSDSQSDLESQSQGRPGRPRKSSSVTEVEAPKKKVSPKSGQVASQELEVVDQAKKAEDEPEPKQDSPTVSPSPQTSSESQESEPEKQTVKDGEELKGDSEVVVEGKSQEMETIETKDSPVVASSPTTEGSQEKTSPTTESGKESEVREELEDDLSQEDSQVNSQSSSDSQSRRRSRRSKPSSEGEDKSKSKDPVGRRSRSSSQGVPSPVEQVEVRVGGRGRRSKVHEDQAKSSPASTPESSQSLDAAGSTGSSQGRGRYSRRSSSQLGVASPGSESTEAKEVSPVPKKRGRKPKVSLQSPLTFEPPKDDKTNEDSVKENSQEEDSQMDTDVVDPPKTQELEGSESVQVAPNPEEQNIEEAPMDVVAEVVKETEIDDTRISESSTSLPQEEQQQQQQQQQEEEEQGDKDAAETETDKTSSQENDIKDLESSEKLEAEEVEEKPPSDTTEEALETPDETDPNHHDPPVVPVEVQEEESHSTSLGQNQNECPGEAEDLAKEEEEEEEKESVKEGEPEESAGTKEDGEPQITTGQEEEEPQSTNTENDNDEVRANLDAVFSEVCGSSDTLSKDIFQGSPAKQKDLEAVMGLDVGQSPSSGNRTRGTWSPSASPSTSILKKGQKRPMEDETPSPLVKSRRVSFANPIQQQETADDIDRRSPAVRTSSPRRSKIGTIPQPKYVTTPTKGLLILSPRNLHSPGYKSSKKCLISEMGQEPRPVSKDCIYPALVGCSTPVEAVLPQISSNMWSRGFGQLVRARNIKTVGDLSALTPTEIKTLPIRSPKISNVKKALKSYELQRKGRGVDELKSFDEMEMMTSEPDVQDDEDKTSAETLATELVDEPLPADAKPDSDAPLNQTPTTPAQRSGGLESDVDSLACRMTPPELGSCSPRQLVQIHERLGDMMRRVVVEMQTRLTQTETRP